MDYITNDIVIGLPNDNPQDLTLNMLLFKERNTNLVMARGDVNDGDTLLNTYKNQLKKLQQQVKAFKCSEPEAATFGKEQLIQGFETKAEYIRGNIHTYQYQVVCQVPSTHKMLAISYTKTTALTEQDKAHWQEIKANLSFA